MGDGACKSTNNSSETEYKHVSTKIHVPLFGRMNSGMVFFLNYSYNIKSLNVALDIAERERIRSEKLRLRSTQFEFSPEAVVSYTLLAAVL